MGLSQSTSAMTLDTGGALQQKLWRVYDQLRVRAEREGPPWPFSFGPTAISLQRTNDATPSSSSALLGCSISGSGQGLRLRSQNSPRYRLCWWWSSIEDRRDWKSTSTYSRRFGRRRADSREPYVALRVERRGQRCLPRQGQHSTQQC